jgi:hypothetical protein
MLKKDKKGFYVLNSFSQLAELYKKESDDKSKQKEKNVKNEEKKKK